MDNTDIFTKRFREVLAYTNIKQVQLAEEIGVSQQCISDFKNGRSFPSIHTLKAICKILDISADYLLGLED